MCFIRKVQTSLGEKHLGILYHKDRIFGRNDTRHNDSRHNDNRYTNTHCNGYQYTNTQHKDTQFNHAWLKVAKLGYFADFLLLSC